MGMLNRINIQTHRKKDMQKKIKPVGKAMLKGTESSPEKSVISGIKGSVQHQRHYSQQISPRDNIKKLKMIDLNDTFLNQDSQNYMLDYSKQHFSAPKSVAPKVFGTAR